MTRYFGRIVGVLFALMVGQYSLTVLLSCIIVFFIVGWGVDSLVLPRIKENREYDELMHKVTIATLRLLGFVAKSDGRISLTEIRSIQHITNLPHTDYVLSRAIIENTAKLPSGAFVKEAQVLYEEFRHDKALLEEIVSWQFIVAMRDGGIRRGQAAIIKATAAIFNLSSGFIAKLENDLGDPEEEYLNPDNYPDPLGGDDAYSILNVEEFAPWATIKKQYRALIVAHHPDKLPQSASLAEKEAAAKQMTRINAAYAVLKKEHSKK